MVLGSMAIMDVQIVTSSLTQIQGGLSASPDEIASRSASVLSYVPFITSAKKHGPDTAAPLHELGGVFALAARSPTDQNFPT